MTADLPTKLLALSARLGRDAEEAAVQAGASVETPTPAALKARGLIQADIRALIKPRPSQPRRSYRRGALTIGDTAPDFEAETSEGPISFHEYLGDSWGVLFSHPRDFTPVCTTELGYMASIKDEFDKRNTKIIGLSVDHVGNHEKWAQDIETATGTAPNYPLICDKDYAVAEAYGMLPADVEGEATERTPAQNQTGPLVFIIGPDKKIKLLLVYPKTTSHRFDEILRIIDALQLTAKYRPATPAQWNTGEDVIITGAISGDEAKEIFGEWGSPLPYIRLVPQPRSS